MKLLWEDGETGIVEARNSNSGYNFYRIYSDRTGYAYLIEEEPLKNMN